MEITPAPAYRFEVLLTHGDAYPAVLFVNMAQAAAYCRQELGGHYNRTDDRAEGAAVAAGQQVRFRGPQGLRWVNGLTSPVPVGTGPALFNPGQRVYTFGTAQALCVMGRDYLGDGWYYQLRDFAEAMPERLLFASPTDPTPPEAAAAVTPAAEPLLFSLHGSQVLAGDAQGQPFWKSLPPRLFVQVKPGQPTCIVALCGACGKRYETHAYEKGPYQLGDGQRVPTMGALGEHFAGQHRAMLPAEGAAMLLGVDGSIREIRPANGKDFRLAQMYEALGCDFIDCHHPQHGKYQDYILVFDDQSKDHGRPINPLATAIWYETYPLDQYSPVDVVAGPVLLMKSRLMR